MRESEPRHTVPRAPAPHTTPCGNWHRGAFAVPRELGETTARDGQNECGEFIRAACTTHGPHTGWLSAAPRRAPPAPPTSEYGAESTVAVPPHGGRSIRSDVSGGPRTRFTLLRGPTAVSL
eukprot:3904781-Prymnesium_polylepis.2